MSGIAEVLLNLGYEISGSDLKLSATTDHLAQLGAKVFEGHDAENVDSAKAVVVSSAVDPSNPEVVEARRRGIPVIPRGELLAELMRLKYGIAIAGSHGKTTTTSMTAAILKPAWIPRSSSAARSRPWAVPTRASDAAISWWSNLTRATALSSSSARSSRWSPTSIANISITTATSKRSALPFTSSSNKVPFYGAAILCLDDENVQQILPSINRRTITYGRSSQADLRITESPHAGISRAVSACSSKGRDLGEFRLNVPGPHNVLNATAAIGIGLELDVKSTTFAKPSQALPASSAVSRPAGEAAGVTVIDDYGHHPTEIRATLAAARLCHFRRIHAIFQPHRYTRTQALLDEFARSFHQADSVYVLDIYAASEKPIQGINGEVAGGTDARLRPSLCRILGHHRQGRQRCPGQCTRRRCHSNPGRRKRLAGRRKTSREAGEIDGERFLG